jgi:hypothetical protein
MTKKYFIEAEDRRQLMRDDDSVQAVEMGLATARELIGVSGEEELDYAIDMAQGHVHSGAEVAYVIIKIVR